MARQKADVAEAKAALEMAHREWANNGLLASDSNNGESGTFEALAYMDAYRGEHPDVLYRATQSVDKMVANMLFSLINTQHSMVTARDPEPLVRPLGGTAASPDAWRKAWLNQKVLQAMSREKKFKRDGDRAVYSSLILPFGAVRHGYTPNVESFENDKGEIVTRFKNETPDLPWIRFMRPWQMRIDPLVNHFDMDSEPRWIAFHNLYTKNQVQNNPELVFRQDWRPTHAEDLRAMHERKKPSVSHGGGVTAGASKSQKADEVSLFEEWVIYNAETRTFFGISPGSESIVREEREWPLDWGQLPASILTMNEQLDSPFGIPFPRMVWSEQQMINKIWTIINALVNRVRRMIIVNGSAFDQTPEQLDNMLNGDSLMEFIVASGGNLQDAAHEVPVGTIDGQLLGLLFQLKEQIREVLGISSFDRGQRANVETAAEANQIGAGADNSKHRVQSKVEGFWTDIFRASHRALLQTEDTRKFTIPIIGEKNYLFLTEDEVARGFVETSPSELAGEFDYGVRPNSTLPHDPAAEFNQLRSAYEAAGGVQAQTANHHAVQTRLFTLAGQDPQQMLVDEKVLSKMGEQNPDGGGEVTQGQAAQGAGVPNAGNVPGAA